MDKIKIGIVGTGFISDFHFNGFKKNPNAEVVGITRDYYGDDKSIQKQKNNLLKKSEEFNIKLFENFEEMISSNLIDALVIASINPLHYNQIKLAIDFNKPVLVEKPLLTNLDELEKIQELCNEKNFKLFPGHNFVYRKSVQLAKKVIEEGNLGEIIHSSFVSTHTIPEEHAFGWRSKKSLSFGGALMDSGHHLVYQSLFLLGKPKKIHGFVSNKVLHNMDGEDLAQISMVYPDNSIAFLMQSWTTNHSGILNGINIMGTDGSLSITDGLYFNGKKIDNDFDYKNSFVNQANAFTDFILF
ncbi:MAG: Gfo/Idh/MocA family oxidoreductase, partial [Ignavibacteriales bacterium]|nr:Gfo/Idh/MocA family oxidoreductase [Ignavibacteriales bacterium]